MEQEIFSYNDGDWDEVDVGVLNFYNITTIIDLPDIPSGTKFSCATVSYATGVLEFYNDDGKEILHKFNLSLKVDKWEQQ